MDASPVGVWGRKSHRGVQGCIPGKGLGAKVTQGVQGCIPGEGLGAKKPTKGNIRLLSLLL